MKKLLIISILIVSVIFISGCTSEDITNSGIGNDLRSSGHLINPSTLSKDYSSSQYHTTATSEMNTFDDPLNTYVTSELYEGDIPDGKKRVSTYFMLTNKENGIRMNIRIYECDSNSMFKEYFPEPDVSWDYPFTNEVNRNGVLTYRTYDREDNFIGDYSSMNSIEFVRKKDGKLLDSDVHVQFTLKNIYINLKTECNGMDSEICQKETMNVVKAIKNQLD